MSRGLFDPTLSKKGIAEPWIDRGGIFDPDFIGVTGYVATTFAGFLVGSPRVAELMPSLLGVRLLNPVLACELRASQTLAEVL